MTSKSNLYDVDFYKWTKKQADLLKNNQLKELDIANLIDEIESLGRSDKRTLRSHINLSFGFISSDIQKNCLVNDGSFAPKEIAPAIFEEKRPSVTRQEFEYQGNKPKTQVIINLFSHLLKIDFQPSKKTKSWDNTFNESLTQIQLIIDDSPSFRRLLQKLAEEAYPLSRFQAARETKLDLKVFPEECPDNYKDYLKFSKK